MFRDLRNATLVPSVQLIQTLRIMYSALVFYGALSIMSAEKVIVDLGHVE